MMKNMKHRGRGFTLVELLAVVGIIAVLVAVSIPIFTSQLSKAKKATCDANRTSLQHMLQYDSMDSNGKTVYELFDAYNKDQMKKDYPCPSGGVFECNKDTGIITCSIHGSPKGSDVDFVSGVIGNLTGGTPSVIYQALKGNTYDSLAPDSNYINANSTSSVSKLAAAELERLDYMGDEIMAWSYSDSALIWTTVDIRDDKFVGTEVPVIKYNLTDGIYKDCYSVWMCKVTQKGTAPNTYNCIDLASMGKECPASLAANSNLEQKKILANASFWYKGVLKDYVPPQ